MLRPLHRQLRRSFGFDLLGQNVVAGRYPLLADHQVHEVQGRHEACGLPWMSWELGPELRSHRCSHIPCELHFCTSADSHIEQTLSGKSQKTQERGSRWSLRTDEGGTGSQPTTSGLLRHQIRLMPASAARPGHQLYPGGGRHRRPAEVPEPSFRPSPRPIPSPGGSGAPAGRSGAPPEARKAPKSKIGLPRPLLKWEAWGARCRFRPLEAVGTASNTCAMGWVVLGGRGAAGGAPV